MSETMHTKGPWVIDGNGVFALEHDGWDKGVERMRNRFWCALYKHRETPAEELEANARLIAASPAMFDYVQRKAKEGDSDAAEIIKSIRCVRGGLSALLHQGA